VAIGIPRVELTQPIRATLWRVGAIALVLTSLGIAAALLVARRIVGALRSVADAPPGTAPRTGLREIDQLAAAIATAEDRRRATADRFRHLADTMPGWVFMTDAAGRNTYVNTTFQEQTGLAEAALMDLGWMSVVHPADRARVADNWNAAVRERRESQVEYRCRLRDGAYRWFLVRARPILDADGGLLQWFGVAVEIHDRLEAEQALKANEAALRSLNNELEGRVRDEVAARETAQRRAAQAERLQALGQLAGGIAHDFNNILQGVQGAAALIERRAADPTQIGKLARMITEAATRGSAITRRLLAFSRRDHLQPAAVDPGALLLGMKDLLQHTVGDGIEIIVETPPDSAAGLPPLWADKASLETVLINLAINGSDAMSGTGRLGLSAGEEIVRDGVPRTRPVALSPGAYIRLSVSDTGIGMDSTILARASEPFFTTKPTGKGTGLGLAMARGFAEQSGGDLRIESTPGQGTIVHLWLPQAGAPPADIEPMARPPRAVHARLLLVDDDEVVRETLTQQMADAGYAVHAVASAAAALAWLDEDEPLDLIVSDLSMPGMDGATMIREALRRRPAVKAILVTGFATEAAADPTILLLQKPITGPDLAEHVALLLAGEPVG
jgi:PAS domain S-box-containing protein